MFAIRTDHARSGKRSPLKLSILMILGGTFCVAVANAAPGQAEPSASVLPKLCLEQSHPSEKITALLEGIHDHPTGGAYNTLGVLYAQADRVSCAISAFEAALKLENQNWEAHYILAVALLGKGDRARATRELQ